VARWLARPRKCQGRCADFDAEGAHRTREVDKVFLTDRIRRPAWASSMRAHVVPNNAPATIPARRRSRFCTGAVEPRNGREPTQDASGLPRACGSSALARPATGS
jgi:hypothetical protein